MGSKTIIKSMLGLLASVGIASASDSVQVDIAPYLWATSMHGTVQVGSEKASISQSFFDLMKHFQGGGMLFLNVHKNRWGIFGNALYSVLSDKQDVRLIPIKARTNFGIFSAGVSYTLFTKHVFDNPSPALTLEVLAGARTTINDTKITVEPLAFKDNQSWTDPIVGLRATVPLTSRLHFIAVSDVGNASTHHSYDIQAYLGYQTVKPLLFDNLTLYLGYRFLHQYFATGNGLKYYLWDMDIKGPVIGFKTVF